MAGLGTAARLGGLLVLLLFVLRVVRVVFWLDGTGALLFNACSAPHCG